MSRQEAQEGFGGLRGEGAGQHSATQTFFQSLTLTTQPVLPTTGPLHMLFLSMMPCINWLLTAPACGSQLRHHFCWVAISDLTESNPLITHSHSTCNFTPLHVLVLTTVSLPDHKGKDSAVLPTAYSSASERFDKGEDLGMFDLESRSGWG